MNNFIQRTLTGFLFVVTLIASIMLSSLSFFCLFLVILILSLKEFYDLSKKTEAHPNYWIGILAGAYIFISSFLTAKGLISPIAEFGIIPAFTLIFILELFRNKENPFNNIAYTILGLIYIALPISLFSFIIFPYSPKSDSFYPEILLGLFILQWANDTGAYLSGSMLGKHRLFERISPKKSWEGSIGGAIVTLGIAYIISLFVPQISMIHWLAIGLIIIVAGTLGDLVESLFKRSIQVKDSGNILPGHGGMLDRFDSIFLATPVVFVYLRIILS